MESIVLICNFQTDIVGSNQIKTMFEPEYKRFITLDRYDCISNYYLQPKDFDSDTDDYDNDI